MKALIKSIILVLIFGISGCIENKDFDFTLPVKIEPEFSINEQDGTWQEIYTVTYNDIADAVDDLDDDINFQDISIEGVTLVLRNQDPSLSGVQHVDLILVDPQGQNHTIFSDEEIMITAGQTTTEVVVTGLVQSGVIAIRDLLEGYAASSSFDSFVLVSSGNSLPAGTPLSMELTAVLHMSLNYSEGFDVPYFLGNE